MDNDIAKVRDEKNATTRGAALEVKVHVPRIKNEAYVQNAAQRDCAPTRQFISSKRMQKLLKRGEAMYLAIVRPVMGQKQGITQKVKQQIMKEKGPVRKLHLSRKQEKGCVAKRR